MLYLAYPYWHESTATRKARVAAVRNAAAEVARLSNFTVKPLASVLFGASVDEGETFGREYWLDFSLKLLARSEAVLVLPLLGWTESEGLRRELHAARSLGLPIYSPAQFRLPQPDAAVMTNAWFGGPEFLSEVNK